MKGLLMSAAVYCACVLAAPAAAQAMFRLGESAGRPVFVDPAGKPFWSLGVCCVEPGGKWEDFDRTRPAYRAFRLFENARTWVTETESQLKSWGFNTLGGWSSVDLFNKYGSKMPFTVVLHLGAYNRAPWKDIFSEETRLWVDRAAREQIEPVRDDPNLIGYFTDNELGWWTDTLFLHYLQNLAPNEPGRQISLQHLRDYYKGDFSAFCREWKTPAKDWEEFARDPKLTLIPGTNGIQAVNHWMAMMGDFYGKLVADAIRKYDSQHLNLGERYVQFYNHSYARAAGKHCDVVSTNLGASWNDGSYSRFFLEGLHKLTKKPIVITEFYMAAEQNRSGNKNTGLAFPKVRTQEERGASFRRCLDELAQRPYVIGAHWFQHHDEPTFGRGDGEDFNFGLVDIHGIPYRELTDRLKGFDGLKVQPLPIASSSAANASRFDPVAEDAVSLKGWPRDLAYVAGKQEVPIADMYVTWSGDALRIGVYTMDYVDPSIYEKGSMAEEERSHFVLDVAGTKIEVRFAGIDMAKKPLPAVVRGPAKCKEAASLTHTLLLEIKSKDLPFKIRPGAKFPLRANLSSHSRMMQMSWDTVVTLSP